MNEMQTGTGARIARRFAGLAAAGRSGLVTFITAGDPDHDTCLALMRGLPAAGADVIELGMPFTDPMADGPSIQAASLRALHHGARMTRTLDLVRAFRTGDTGAGGTGAGNTGAGVTVSPVAGDCETPIILMGYYNPIYRYGVDRFLTDARAAGVDGLIVVDIPPEADDELCQPALAAGLSFIRLTAPTTDDRRLPTVLRHTSGFVYYVSITGITGAAAASEAAVTAAVARLRRHTGLPIAVGFGIRSPEQAAAIARVADAAVVGSAIVDRIAAGLNAAGRPDPTLVADVLAFVGTLAVAVQGARQ